MLYKQVKCKGKTEDILIVDYGYIWKDELLRCLGVEKMSVLEAAEVSQCNSQVVSWQKKKLVLCKKREYTIKLRRYDVKIGAENYYKAQVLSSVNSMMK